MRKLMNQGEKKNNTPHILLIDDDPIFRHLVTRRAAQRNIQVTACQTLKEVSPMLAPRLFDAAIVDYFLNDLKRNLRGTDVAFALEGTPIVLTSATNAVVEFDEPWAS